MRLCSQCGMPGSSGRAVPCDEGAAAPDRAHAMPCRHGSRGNAASGAKMPDARPITVRGPACAPPRAPGRRREPDAPCRLAAASWQSVRRAVRRAGLCPGEIGRGTKSGPAANPSGATSGIPHPPSGQRPAGGMALLQDGVIPARVNRRLPTRQGRDAHMRPAEGGCRPPACPRVDAASGSVGNSGQ